MELYKKYTPTTYLTRELYRKVQETGDLRYVWAWTNAQKWVQDYNSFLLKCGDVCACCGSKLHYGIGKNMPVGGKASDATPSTDHIIPVSVAPELKADPENLWIICMSCNIKKNDSTPDDIHRLQGIIRVLESIKPKYQALLESKVQ